LQPTPHLQIFINATTTLWGWAGSIINLLSYVLKTFWQKLRTVQEWGADKKGSFFWEGCLKISFPKTRKCHCTAQMHNSAHNTISKREYLYSSALAGVTGDFQYTLRRESSRDGSFASRKAQPEIPNLHPNFTKHVQNASNCGASIMKGIILWNSITCKGER
jgi:hypothetical protein